MMSEGLNNQAKDKLRTRGNLCRNGQRLVSHGFATYRLKEASLVLEGKNIVRKAADTDDESASSEKLSNCTPSP